MSGPKWTPAQQAAIADRGGALLVSAAAGSGKTAVLTERAVQLITDPEHPVNADRLLIVTFTNAAAAELRARIGQALLHRSQLQPVAVGGIAQLRGHELLKEIVDARHHLRRGAEVCIQCQQGVRARGALRRAGTGFCARQQRPAVQLLPEDARLCLPETVDALF